MRASPALQVTLTAFGAWRAAVAALTLAAAAMPWAWLAARSDAPSLWSLGAAGLLSASALACGLRAARVTACSLRWDGQRWHLGAPSSIGNEPLHGTLAVVLDFGDWMLLRLAADPPARPAIRWLPAQRRGLEPAWHALRCAVHAPQAMADRPDGRSAA
ncbi:MAG: hypothetical protein JSR59_01440 [Proteobacteria bacterium]|nr:hypothetical protein [Pseudomonadota bacterium]